METDFYPFLAHTVLQFNEMQTKVETINIMESIKHSVDSSHINDVYNACGIAFVMTNDVDVVDSAILHGQPIH